MEMNVNEQQVERNRLIAQMRTLHEKAHEEKRDFTSEENQQYKNMNADVDKLKASIDRHYSLEMHAKDNAHRAEPIRPGVVNPEGAVGEGDIRATADYRKAFMQVARFGEAAVPMQIKATLQKATTGGFLVPTEFETQIVLKLYQANLMRRLATVTRTTSTVNIPMEGNLPTFGWIGELGTYPATDATIAQQILAAWKLGGIMSISEELLDDAFLDVPAYIAGRAALSASFAEEAAFIVGDGNQKPTGALTTILASGSTVVAGAQTTILSADIFKLYYGLAFPYRVNASFVFADSAMLTLRSEKATTGQYIWQPGLSLGAPDLLLGRPVYTSAFLPAVAHLSVSGMFGDFSYYHIVDRIGWSMQRLNELYAANGMVGFRMWERTDGKLLRPEAIVSITQP